MGVLVEVESESFLLPAKHFTAAKRALEALAVASPSSFEVPRSVSGCKDLREALGAAFWRFEPNEGGDLVALSYGADKAPDSGMWPESVLDALAPFVTRGAVVYRVEGDDRETVYTFAKGKIGTKRRKRAKPKRAAPPKGRATATDAAWIVAPPDSYGIEWRARLPGGREWYRNRDRVTSLLESLAKTKVWRELEQLHSRSDLLPVAPQGGELPVGEVVKRVADAQWGTRWLASRDRQTTLELAIGMFELGFRLRVRDGALVRVGSAVIDEIAPVLASYARAYRSREPAIGHAGPFGRGYLRPADLAGAVLIGENLSSDEIHFRAHALATVFDGKAREAREDDDEPEATAKTIRALAAAKKVPAGARRSEEDGVVVVTFPCDVVDREAARKAAAAHAKWIAGFSDVAGTPAKLREPEKAAKKNRKSDDPALEDYTLWGRFELTVDDDPYWFRDRAFFEVVIRAFARTAYWTELVKPGPDAVAKAISAVITGRNDKRTVLKRGDEVKLELSPNVHELVVQVSARRPVLTKLGARAVRDLIAFLGEVLGALAGRGTIEEAYIAMTSEEWDAFVGHASTDSVLRWPRVDALVDFVAPRETEDGRNGRQLQIARTLCAAPLPPGAERIDVGGAVALLFGDDPSDPVATADACARRAAWLRSVQAFAGVGTR